MDRRIISNTLALAIVSFATVTGSAQDFRIETEIFFGKSKEPTSENLTLFSGGVVYDFMLTGSNEIAIFDATRERFVLLDPTQKKKLTLTSDLIIQFVTKLRVHEFQKKAPFFFAPEFDQTFDEKENSLTLASPRMTYKVKGLRPEDTSAAVQYRKFADWYSRLNATIPGSMPPFPRLKLNEILAEKGLIPERVELTVTPKKRLVQKKLEVTSRHLIIWQLSKRDREKIEKANTYRASFQAVSFEEYRQITSVASNRKN